MGKELDKYANWNPESQAFGKDLSIIASRLASAGMRDGMSADKAITLVIHTLLDCAAGQACRLAVDILGRDPDPDKWKKATEKAFEKAIKRTAEREPAKQEPHP